VEGEGERRDGEGSDEDYWQDPERDMSEEVGDGEPGSGPGDLTYHTRPQPLTQRPKRRARRRTGRDMQGGGDPGVEPGDQAHQPQLRLSTRPVRQKTVPNRLRDCVLHGDHDDN
jgi:hypothetical protein